MWKNISWNIFPLEKFKILKQIIFLVCVMKYFWVSLVVMVAGEIRSGHMTSYCSVTGCTVSCPAHAYKITFTQPLESLHCTFESFIMKTNLLESIGIFSKELDMNDLCIWKGYNRRQSPPGATSPQWQRPYLILPTIPPPNIHQQHTRLILKISPSPLPLPPPPATWRTQQVSGH